MIAACRSVGSVSFSVIVLLFFCIDLHAPGCCCFCGFFVVGGGGGGGGGIHVFCLMPGY